MARRFRFSLATVQRVRESHEREAKRRVGVKLAEIAQLDQRVRSYEERIAQTQSGLRELQGDESLDITAVTRDRAWIAHLRRVIAQEGQKRAVLLQELAPLQAAMREARKQTRIIEKLREKRWTEHVRSEALREQHESDEMARDLLLRQANEAHSLDAPGDHGLCGADKAD